MAGEDRFVTRNPGFIQIPNDLWDARTEGGMEAYHDAEVYGWLWRFGHGSEHGYYGTVAKLAAVAHIKERHVRQSLRRLELAGFITRTERLGMTSLYRTYIDPVCAPRATTNPLPHGAPPASRGTPLPPAPQGPPPPASRGTPTPCPVRPPKQEPKNKNPENKKKTNSPQPAAARDPGPEPEPAPAPLAIAPRTAACPKSPDPAMAALVIEAWNHHKPATWPAIQRLGAKRWPVVVEWSQELGGFQEFLDAIPIALAAAARDPWWGQKVMDWANFMGHGPKSTKQHFLRFYERGMDQPAAPSAAAGLSQYAQRMLTNICGDQPATTANPIDITESSRC